MRRWYKGDDPITNKLNRLLSGLYQEFGWTTRIIAELVGRYLYQTMKREDRRLVQGWAYEPDTFYEHNEAAALLASRPAQTHRAQPMEKIARMAAEKTAPAATAHTGS